MKLKFQYEMITNNFSCKFTCFLLLTMQNLTTSRCTIAHTTSQWHRKNNFIENKLWEPNYLLCCEFCYYYCCFCNTHSFTQSRMHLLQHSACYWFILLFERRRIKCVIIFQVYGIVRRYSLRPSLICFG